MIRFHTNDNGGGAPAPEPTPAPEGTPAPAAAEAAGVSREEFDAVSKQLQQVSGIVPTVQQIAQFIQSQQEPETDDDDLDIDEYINQQVEQRVAPLRAPLKAAQERAGKETLKELLNQHESNPEIGKFDHSLAEQIATAVAGSYNDPTEAVLYGAREASRIRKEYTKAGEEEYKASLKKGPHDLEPGAGGSGERSPMKAKSYDEVIEAYAGTTEA